MTARWRPNISNAVQFAMNHRLRSRQLDLQRERLEEQKTARKDAALERGMLLEREEFQRTGRPVVGRSAEEERYIRDDFGGVRAFHKDTSDQNIEDDLRRMRAKRSPARQPAAPQPEEEDADSLFASIYGVNEDGVGPQTPQLRTQAAQAEAPDPARERMEQSRLDNMRLLDDRRRERATAGLPAQSATAFEDEEAARGVDLTDRMPDDFFGDEDVDIDDPVLSEKTFARGDVIEGRAPAPPPDAPEPKPQTDLDWLPFTQMSKEEAAAAAARAYGTMPQAIATQIDAEASRLADLMRSSPGDDPDTLISRAKAYLGSTLVDDPSFQRAEADRYGQQALSRDTMEAVDRAKLTAPYRQRGSRSGRSPEEDAAFRRKTEYMKGLALRAAQFGDAQAAAELRRLSADEGSFDAGKIANIFSSLQTQQARDPRTKVDLGLVRDQRRRELETLTGELAPFGEKMMLPEERAELNRRRRAVNEKYDRLERGTVGQPRGGGIPTSGVGAAADFRAYARKKGVPDGDLDLVLQDERKYGERGLNARVRLLIDIMEATNKGGDVEALYDRLNRMRGR